LIALVALAAFAGDSDKNQGIAHRRLAEKPFGRGTRSKGDFVGGPLKEFGDVRVIEEASARGQRGGGDLEGWSQKKAGGGPFWFRRNRLGGEGAPGKKGGGKL